MQLRGLRPDESGQLLQILSRQGGPGDGWRRAQAVLLAAQGLDAAQVAAAEPPQRKATQVHAGPARRDHDARSVVPGRLRAAGKTLEFSQVGRLPDRARCGKSVQDAAPVLLHSPARIEALFCCQFLAALIEREVRNSKAREALDSIELYPELRSCRAPSTERILEIFTDLSRHQLHHDGTAVRTFQPELSAQQQQVLDLLGLPHSAYAQQP